MLKSLHSQWFLVHEGCHQALQVFRYKHACHLSHVQKLPCQALVPMSVAAIYCVGQYGLIIFANDFIQDTLSTSFGLATMPPFAPPNGRPAAAHFHVIVLASLNISVGVTVSANRIPPFPGPVDVLSITKTPFMPVSGS